MTTSRLFVLLLLLPVLLFAQDRGMRIDQRTVGQEKRVALVIGNGAYKASPLRNPVNDAKAMASTLRSLGFAVVEGNNLNQEQMENAIRDFGGQLRKGGVGLFYFAGHGVQVNGSNYLIPINADIQKETEVRYKAVDAGLVLAQMEDAGNGVNIVILDACRNNPFARSWRSATNGLATVDAPKGTIVSYATAPGRVANDGDHGNGLYTERLLHYMIQPGLTIEQLFKRVRRDVEAKTNDLQTPWEQSSLTGDFYFLAADKEGRNADAIAQDVNTETSAPRTDILRKKQVHEPGQRSEGERPNNEEIGFLPSDELVAYYPFNGNADDESGHGNGGIAVGTTLTSDRFGRNNSAYWFANCSFIRIPELFSDSVPAFTIALWVKKAYVDKKNHMILIKGSVKGEASIGNVDGNIGFGVNLHPAGGRVSDQRWYSANTPDTLRADVYYFLVGRYIKGQRVDLTINGLLVASIRPPNMNMIVETSRTYSAFGIHSQANFTTGYCWNGIIDDVRIYSRALTDQEISSLYHEGGWTEN